MRQFRLLILLVCIAFSSLARADLKTYDVDPSYGQEVFRAFANILVPREGVSYGSISSLSTGQILIDTTPEMHAQIAAVLESISRYRAEPTPRVTLQYWVVLGMRDSAATVEMPPVLRNVLDEIRQVHGPLSFRILGNASLVTDSGREGRANGNLAISQTAFVQDDTLNASMRIDFQMQMERIRIIIGEDGTETEQSNYRTENQSVSMNISMQRGEFVVVGENTLSDAFVTELGVDGTIFYIVHWPAN